MSKAAHTSGPWWGDGRGTVLAGVPGTHAHTLQALRWLVSALEADADTNPDEAVRAYEAAMDHAIKVLAFNDGVTPTQDALSAYVAQLGGRHA